MSVDTKTTEAATEGNTPVPDAIVVNAKAQGWKMVKHPLSTGEIWSLDNPSVEPYCIHETIECEILRCAVVSEAEAWVRLASAIRPVPPPVEDWRGLKLQPLPCPATGLWLVCLSGDPNGSPTIASMKCPVPGDPHNEALAKRIAADYGGFDTYGAYETAQRQKAQIERLEKQIASDEKLIALRGKQYQELADKLHGEQEATRQRESELNAKLEEANAKLREAQRCFDALVQDVQAVSDAALRLVRATRGGATDTDAPEETAEENALLSSALSPEAEPEVAPAMVDRTVDIGEAVLSPLIKNAKARGWEMRTRSLETGTIWSLENSILEPYRVYETVMERTLPCSDVSEDEAWNLLASSLWHQTSQFRR